MIISTSQLQQFEGMDSCLFHDNKLAFSIACKEIKRAKLLPKDVYHRLAMGVCSCRREKICLQEILTENDLEEAATYIETLLRERTDLNPNVTVLLRSVVDKCTDMTNYSHCKLAYILYEYGRCGQCSQLSLQAINSPKKAYMYTGESVREKKPKVHNKLTRQQYRFLMKKRLQQKQFVNKAQLSIFPGNVKKLTTCTKYVSLKPQMNPVYVYFCDEENTRHMAANRKITEVNVYCKYQKQSEHFIRKLQDMAHELQQSLDIKRKERLRMYKLERGQSTDDHDDHFNLTELALSLKETSVKDFEKTHRKKTKNTKGKSRQSSYLTGGHCLQCLQPFNGNRIKENDPTCKYHKGLTVNEVWTCCNETSEIKKPTHTEHLKTGCCTGVHNWRTNRKISCSNKKVSKSLGKLKNRTKTLVTMNTCNRPYSVIQRAETRGRDLWE